MVHAFTNHDRPSTMQRPTPNRLVAVLAIALALASTTGCMVMDELDTAAAKMPTTAAEKNKKAAASPSQGSAAERLAATKSMLAERSEKWWSEAKTMTPGESVSGVVTCRLPEGTKFMSKDDCLSQGGTPAERGS